MATVPCSACGNPMAAIAVVCPHCNARRTDVKPGLAGKQLAPEEIAALIAVDGTKTPPTEGLFATMVMPHPSSTGAARGAELALTVIASPLIAVGGFAYAAMQMRGRVGPQRAYKTTQGELAPVLITVGLGGYTLAQLLSIGGVAFATNMAVTAAGIVAVIARGIIRARSLAAARKPTSPAQLPVARALVAPPPEAPPSGGPRLLR